ncbi:amidohydrolase family protein [Smaragdicoccus niigatensis]|uniref:amidohydrolase family protein n=1 Tax=Smaragdicoccus niigatensis TaxID=359359 RepID=UPI000B2CDF8A|nr:amidohydrolase family protein [Smaragdicoccus niigatensis]
MADLLLLRGGVVLTMDPDIGDLAIGDVLIEDGRIAAVGQNLVATGADTVDCSGKIVIPGFVNSHHHMFQTALRSYWSDGLELDYFMQSRFGSEALFHQYSPDDVYWGELGGALENLAAGTTTVVDTSQCSYTPEHTDAALDGIRRSGIRCVFSYSPVFGDHEAHPAYAHPEDIGRIVDAAGDSGLVSLALGYHVDEDLFRLARDLDLPVFAHVNDANWGRVLEEFESDGLLGPLITYIHCLDLADSSWKAIARTGGKVSVSSIAEQTLAMGHPALQAALSHGVPVSFGTDAVSIAPVDFFSQMRAAFCLQRGAIRTSGESTPLPLSTRETLRIATLGGAQAAHLDHLVGSLTPGKRADVVVLNARALNAGPVLNAPGAVVHMMDTSNVETVLVDGRIVKSDGRLIDVDTDHVLDKLAASAEGLLSRSGARNIFLTSCRHG